MSHIDQDSASQENLLMSLSDGAILHATENGESVRWIVAKTIPYTETVVRPATKKIDANDLTVHEFLNLEWRVQSVEEPTVDSLRELARVSKALNIGSTPSSQYSKEDQNLQDSIDAWLFYAEQDFVKRQENS